MKKKLILFFIVFSLALLGILSYYFVLKFSTPDEFSELHGLVNKAAFYYKNSKYDSAAIIYLDAGKLMQKKSLYDTALYYSLKARDVVIENLDSNNYNYKKLLSDIYYEIGDVKITKASYDDAFFYLNKGFNICKKNYDSKDSEYSQVVKYYYKIGIANFYAGNSETALKYYDTALNICFRYNDGHSIEVGNIYYAIGQIYYDQSNFEEFLKYNQKAKIIFLDYYDNGSAMLAKIYNNIGVVHIEKKRYHEAMKNLKEASRICKIIKGEESGLITYIYNNIANIHYYKEDYKNALNYYLKVLKIRKKLLGKNHPEVAFLYHNLALYYKKLNDYEKSLKYYNKSLKIRKIAFGEKHVEVARSYRNIGIVYLLKQDYNAALEYFQKAIISNITGYNEKNEFNNPELRNILSNQDLFEILEQKARAFYERYKNSSQSFKDLEAAIITSDLAIDLLDSIRIEFKPEGSRLLLSEQAKSSFMDAINFSFEINNTDSNFVNYKAFELTEKSKSNILFASLQDSYAKTISGIPVSLLLDEKNINQKLAEYKTEIIKETQKFDEYDTLKIRNLENRYYNLETKQDSLIKYFEINFPKYHKYKHHAQLVPIPDIQSELPENSALLEYFIGDSNIFIFTLTSEKYNVVKIPIDTNFAEQVIEYVQVIKKVSGKSIFNKLSSSLFSTLIKPVRQFIDKKEQLIIIPDDYLYYVPFESLISNNYTQSIKLEFSDLQYLISDYCISYNHSASLWYKGRRKIIAQKTSDKRTNNFIGFAPVFIENSKHTNSNKTELTDSNTGAFTHQSLRETLNPLPHTQLEIDRIAQLYKDNGNRAFTYVNDDATESNFKNNIKNCKYLHIATHGFSNDSIPELTWLAFSPEKELIESVDEYNLFTNDSNKSINDGILYAEEMSNLNINADLVVLSTCESGIGKLVKGEGLMAMTRGFLYSGASNIVFSLWNVNDKQTSELMVSFYKEILSGNQYSSALQEAKLKLIMKHKTSHPVFWSGFLLIGE